MDLEGRHSLPDKELEELLGLKYDVKQNPGRCDTYEGFLCEGSEEFDFVEVIDTVFIVRQIFGGDHFQVEIIEESTESGTSYYLIAEPWEGHESGFAKELMKSVSAWQGRADWALSTSYRLFAPQPDAVLTLSVATVPQDDALLLSFSHMSGTEVHSERVRPGDVLRGDLYQDLAGNAGVSERCIKIATADGRMLARPGEQGACWSEWLAGADAGEDDDVRQLVNDRAMTCLAKECDVSPAASHLSWERHAVGSDVDVKRACHEAGFFKGVSEPPELADLVMAGLGGDDEVTVDAYYESAMPGMFTFHAIVFGGAHKGKVLLELTLVEEMSFFALLKALCCTSFS